MQMIDPLYIVNVHWYMTSDVFSSRKSTFLEFIWKQYTTLALMEPVQSSSLSSAVLL